MVTAQGLPGQGRMARGKSALLHSLLTYLPKVGEKSNTSEKCQTDKFFPHLRKTFPLLKRLDSVRIASSNLPRKLMTTRALEKGVEISKLFGFVSGEYMPRDLVRLICEISMGRGVIISDDPLSCETIQLDPLC